MSLNENFEFTVITADGEDWKREKVSVAGIRRMFSEWISPSYKDKMLRLRDIDESIREWAKILKITVRELKKAFKAGRIVDVAILFARLNKNIKTLVEVGGGVKDIYEEAISEFEAEHELTDYDILKELHGKKESAFWGDLARKHIGSKFYGKELRERNFAVRQLISKAEHVYRIVEGYLDEMKSARNKGDIGRYVDMIKNISDKQKEFEESFIPVYNKYLRKSVERIIKKQDDKVERDIEKLKVEKPTEITDIEVPKEEGRLGQKAEEVPFMPAPETETLQRSPEVAVESAPPTPITKKPIEVSEEEIAETEEEPSPPTLRSFTSGDNMDEIMKEAHEEFVKGLAAFDDPRKVALALLKYAELIENEDLETSLKLMAIAEGIL